MALTDGQFERYLEPLDDNQKSSVRVLRELIREREPHLDEAVCTDKWYGGLLVYTAANGYPIYALGPRSAGKSTLHMMPFYGSTALQERHGAALKKFASGKSCLMFVKASELPLDAIRDICTGGSQKLLQALEERDASRKQKKSAS